MDNKNNYNQVNELIETSNKNIINFIKQGRTKDILKNISKFPDYSVANIALIMEQAPNAICLNPNYRWEELNCKLVENPVPIKHIKQYLKKENVDHIDKDGNVYVQDVENFSLTVGYLYDISQVQNAPSQESYYDKEEISKYFDNVRYSLENLTKGYKVEYAEQEEDFAIDDGNKKIIIKNGLSLDCNLSALIKGTTKILLTTRKQEGISQNQLENIDDVDYNACVYIVNKKLGLDLPECDFSELTTLSDKTLNLFKYNLRKDRSIAKQILTNCENAMEYAKRNQNKQRVNYEEREQKVEKQKENSKEFEEE